MFSLIILGANLRLPFAAISVVIVLLIAIMIVIAVVVKMRGLFKS